VQLKVTTGELEVQDDPEPASRIRGPLAVLVDRFSASASEIFAGALQDYHRARFSAAHLRQGHGAEPRAARPLVAAPVNGQLTVTIGKFYRVTGESTQHRGVEPDVTLPSQIDMEEFGESALEGALPWDRIAGVPFRSEGQGTAAEHRRCSRRKRRRAPTRIPTTAGWWPTSPRRRHAQADLAVAQSAAAQEPNASARQRRLTARTRAAPRRTCRAQDFGRTARREIPGHRARPGDEVMTDMVTGHVRSTPLRPAPCAERAKRRAELVRQIGAQVPMVL
jgi:carboxyl-terminal processing protease